MSIQKSLNALSKKLLGIGIFDAWQQAPQTKQASQKAQQLAQNLHLREAIAFAEKALAKWSKKPSFWERLICQLLMGKLLETVTHQLKQWHKQVAEADKLAASAKNLLQQDTGEPGETQALAGAIAFYQRFNKILYDQGVVEATNQCQQELQRRKQFQELVTQAQSQAENRFFKNAIATYRQAEQLYFTEALQQAIATAQTQVPQEDIFDSAFQRARQAEIAGKLRGAIAILEAAVTKFPRSDGLDLLQKLQQTIQGREQFRQGLAAEKAGDFKTAVSLYQNAKLILPNSTDCQIRLGLVAIKTQDWATALSHLESLSGEQAAYLRGFAHAQQENLQLANQEWQKISTNSIVPQQEILQTISQRQRLLSLQNIENLVKAENLEQAKTASTEFIQKFGWEELIEANLQGYIQPRLEAQVWQGDNWEFISNEAEKNWIAQPNITTLHNWAVANYYHAQSDPTKLSEAMIALATALANLTEDPILQDVPWRGNQKVNFESVALELKRRIESAIESFKDSNINEYLKLRDRWRLESVALRLINQPPTGGMKIQDIFITPGFYQRYITLWQHIIVEQIDTSQKNLHSLYTPWGLAVAACIEGDSQRAIQIKPSLTPTTDVEIFAQKFLAYHQGCHYLQQQKWREAIIYLKQAKSEIQVNQNWQQETDRLCGLQRQAISESELQENLEFAQLWYEILDSQPSRSYLAEYKTEELRERLTQDKISLEKALVEIQQIKFIDEQNPVVKDMIARLEISKEFADIDRLLKQNRYEEAVRNARRSHHDQVRFTVAEFFIKILIDGINNGDLKDYQSIQQLGRWAYEICPHEPAFQEVFHSLHFT